MISYDAQCHTRILIQAFLAWKSLLLLIAVSSGLGPGAYDTSSTLLSPDAVSFKESPFDLATRLTRWDAIYFVQNARRGYVFEQEWAFGGGLPTVISGVVKLLGAVGIGNTGSLESWIGVSISHVSHLLSVLVLYQLGLKVLREPRLSFIAALLHVISPAGLFLSAPYNESAFALLSFTGYLLFAHGLGSRGTLNDLSILGSGIVFGLATTFRSNGLLSGIPFAVYAIIGFANLVEAPNFLNLRRLIALGLGGLSVALGSIGPQAIAYFRFCSGSSASEPRPWCAKRLPSIYTFVQERYWGVGFLRYWTPGNIPLFLLAVPMIYLMMRSGLDILTNRFVGISTSKSQSLGSSRILPPGQSFLRTMAASQVILTALAITTYHVQIITRISSAYPVWYWWLAQNLQEGTRFADGAVVFMVMYAAIQGVLFASFLPPA
ncbi:GPI mannosyltransferase 2 [Pseudomassariella vexata]|uniref:GPI mannosyltransferase 2 n=1 Tax=Pseudomassariella vexata TaxID=1141098 RepID=A0A1Y2DQP1_9PEZI|nr:GPI mannosyltransferase 2 [Pseudomassariella vexata]ORY61537.1 GPI mannosyltransferase 2 [Pseudomassariella vexata]